MSEQNVASLMGATLEKIKNMFSADTVIGDKIVVDGVTIIPVSKLSVGIASGGADISNKIDNDNFAGGGGAGASVTPVGFLVVKDGDVRMISVTPSDAPLAIAAELIPDALEKIKDVFNTKKSDTKEND